MTCDKVKASREREAFLKLIARGWFFTCQGEPGNWFLVNLLKNGSTRRKNITMFLFSTFKHTKPTGILLNNIKSIYQDKTSLSSFMLQITDNNARITSNHCTWSVNSTNICIIDKITFFKKICMIILFRNDAFLFIFLLLLQMYLLIKLVENHFWSTAQKMFPQNNTIKLESL